MGDEYVKRDDKGIVVLDGNRSGKERRNVEDRRRKWGLREGVDEDLRRPGLRRVLRDRRVMSVLSFRDKVYEKGSCVVIGLFLLFLGLFSILTGLTFLPILGVYVGVFLVVTSFYFMAEAWHP